MFLKRIIYLIILVLLSSNSVYSQKIFREAYIVKNNGDILNGLVEYSVNQGVPSACVFKRFDIAVEIRYKPGKIKEFGYIYGNRYISKNIDDKDSFYEVLVSGNITLYQKDSKYFLQKGKSGMTELVNGSIEYTVDDETQTYDGLSSFLKYITEGKAGTIKEKLNPKKELVPIITEYNRKSGNPFIVYNQEYSDQMLINELNRSGANLNRYGVLLGINMYSMYFKSEANIYFPDPEPEIAFTGGLYYEKLLSRKNDKLCLRMEFMFLRQNFYTYSEESTSTVIYRDDAFFDFTGIKLPLLFKYFFTSGKAAPYINAGVSSQAFIQKNYLHIREIENTSNEINTKEDSYFKINIGEISGLCGAGLKLRMLNSVVLDIQGRIEIGHGLFNEGEDAKEYRQHSLQPSLLIGFTF